MKSVTRRFVMKARVIILLVAFFLPAPLIAGDQSDAIFQRITADNTTYHTFDGEVPVDVEFLPWDSDARTGTVLLTYHNWTDSGYSPSYRVLFFHVKNGVIDIQGNYFVLTYDLRIRRIETKDAQQLVPQGWNE